MGGNPCVGSGAIHCVARPSGQSPHCFTASWLTCSPLLFGRPSSLLWISMGVCRAADLSVYILALYVGVYVYRPLYIGHYIGDLYRASCTGCSI